MRDDAALQAYYEHVQTVGKLLSFELAERWSRGVLKTLGFHLNGRTKRSLAKVIPEPLSDDVKDVFFLLHFKDKELSGRDFQSRSLSAVAIQMLNSLASRSWPFLAVYDASRIPS